ncbi:MAG: hypothetical protein JO044_07460 [Mycobacteriaceae bacterium]|nr:hypothetical protein [Mycobacteriaceae bacterium]MBV9641768.1 hypothetical protein [Mycobacteriaceae bacterium]
MSTWFNYIATLKIILFGLIVGAGLPALFAVGVRLNAEGVGVVRHDGEARRNPLLLTLGWVIFAVVLAVVILGVLYIASDFIGHHTGWYILGAKRGK